MQTSSSGDGSQMEKEEWTQVSKSCLQRRLRGAEVLINYSEQHQNGNYQLIHSADLDTSLTGKELESRIYSAWCRTRLHHPVVAIELVSESNSLNYATFHAVNNEREAEEWTKSTCRIVKDGRSVQALLEDCLQRPLPKTTSALLYLVISPRIGLAGIVLHNSHVLSGHDALNIISTCSQELLESSTHLESEDISLVKKRLPISVVHIYRQRCKPSLEDMRKAQERAAIASERYAKPTIGVPVQIDWQIRRSKCHTMKFTIESEEMALISQGIKKSKSTLTSIFYACICSAMAQMYYQGQEKGAHLTFSAHAKRWFSTDGDEDGQYPITMAIIPGGAWIEATKEELEASTVEGLQSLAEKIGSASLEDISNAHIIHVMDTMGEAIVTNPAVAASSVEPTIGRPTLTSQGVLDTKSIEQKNDGSWLRIADWNYAGRNTDPVVCFAASIVRRQFHYHVLFDERYFPLDQVQMLAWRVGTLFRLFASVTALSHL